MEEIDDIDKLKAYRLLKSNLEKLFNTSPNAEWISEPVVNYRVEYEETCYETYKTPEVPYFRFVIEEGTDICELFMPKYFDQYLPNLTITVKNILKEVFMDCSGLTITFNEDQK
jgi:hypothetical protein